MFAVNFRNHTDSSSASIDSFPNESEQPKQWDNKYLASEQGGKRNICSSSGTLDHSQGCLCTIELDDILGPETPGMRPLVPRLKRIQEEICNVEDKDNSSSVNTVKRAKFLQDSKPESKNYRDDSEMTSKFEWLHPSRIRDADGRKRDDPLYDKTTLYIPPDVFKKMSASQKQYWEVKRRYMDVVIFFKVVSSS